MSRLKICIFSDDGILEAVTVRDAFCRLFEKAVGHTGGSDNPLVALPLQVIICLLSQISGSSIYRAERY